MSFTSILIATAIVLPNNLIKHLFRDGIDQLPLPELGQAFMGEVAMWTGIVTGTLMCISPLLFKRMGWRGVAGATPAFLLVAGTPFFLGCIILAMLQPSAATGTLLLRCLVMFGALLQVIPSSFVLTMHCAHAGMRCNQLALLADEAALGMHALRMCLPVICVTGASAGTMTAAEQVISNYQQRYLLTHSGASDFRPRSQV